VVIFFDSNFFLQWFIAWLIATGIVLGTILWDMRRWAGDATGGLPWRAVHEHYGKPKAAGPALAHGQYVEYT